MNKTATALPFLLAFAIFFLSCRGNDNRSTNNMSVTKKQSILDDNISVGYSCDVCLIDSLIYINEDRITTEEVFDKIISLKKKFQYNKINFVRIYSNDYTDDVEKIENYFKVNINADYPLNIIQYTFSEMNANMKLNKNYKPPYCSKYLK